MLKPSTQLKALVKRLSPLADWMKTNRPECDTIAVFKKDWDYLSKTDIRVLRTCAFDRTKDGITYGRFKLRCVEPEQKK